DLVDALLGVRALDDGEALALEALADHRADLGVVVDDEDQRRPAATLGLRQLLAARALHEPVEVVSPEAAMATRCLEGLDAPHVGPLAHGALRNAEVAGGLTEGQPLGRLLGGMCSRAAIAGHAGD